MKPPSPAETRLADKMTAAIGVLVSGLKRHVRVLDEAGADEFMASLDIFDRMVADGADVAVIVNLLATMARRLGEAAATAGEFEAAAELGQVEARAVKLRDGWANWSARRRRR